MSSGGRAARKAVTSRVSAAGWSRRHVLEAGAAGLLGLSWPRLRQALAAAPAAARPPRARSVIFLFQFGGPSQLDLFDMKPEAPSGIKSPLDAISTRLPGVPICANLPRTAGMLDRVTLVRSVHHGMKNHNPASYYALTGHAPPLDDIRLRDSLELFPAYGSVVDRLAPGPAELPTFVALPHVLRDGEITPGQHASFLTKRHDPLLVTEDPNDPEFRLPQLSLPAGLSPERLANRRAVQQLVDRQRRLWEYSSLARDLDANYQTALAMLDSPRVRQAFDLEREPAAVRERYGRTTYGQSCLLARRLVEAGVRFVNVYFSQSIGGQSVSGGGWDTHGFNNTRMYPIIESYHLPLTDQTLPTLLEDLEERGLLETTLVVWMGEFGRTPRINSNASRDHWPGCYTVLLAGGGVQRGAVYGASDRHAAEPARDPVRLEDLAATMFSLLGVDPHAELFDPANRPLPVAPGRVLDQILA